MFQFNVFGDAFYHKYSTAGRHTVPLYESTAVYLYSTAAQTLLSLPLVSTFLPAAIEAWRDLQRYVTLSYIYRL